MAWNMSLREVMETSSGKHHLERQEVLFVVLGFERDRQTEKKKGETHIL